MLATIQLMVHTPMFGIAYPGNARLFFSTIIDLVNLKLINVDWILKKIGVTFVSKSSSLSKEAEFGYSGNLCEAQEPCLLLLLVFQRLSAVFGFLLYRNCKSKSPLLKKILILLANKIIFNTFIRSFITGYLGLASQPS